MAVLTTTSRRRPPAGHLLAIDRGLDLHLFVHAGQGEHLADCFRATFARLPRSAANLLLAYWADGATPPLLPSKPTLELQADLRPGFEVSLEAPTGTIYAVTSRRGHRIQFAARVTELMPARVLAVLVAHELIHAHQWLSQPPEVARLLDVEAHAREISAEWGFDPDLLDHWRPSLPSPSSRRTHRVPDWKKSS
jgi:hypothetical protein